MFEDVCQDLMTCFTLALQLCISFGQPGHPGPGLLAVLAVTTEDIPRWGTSLLSMLMDLVPWILREARDQFDNRAARAAEKRHVICQVFRRFYRLRSGAKCQHKIQPHSCRLLKKP